MGGAASVRNRRYLGGKTIETYFKEDFWSFNETLFNRLHFYDNHTLKVFKIFCRLDANKNGLADSKECLDFIGGPRSRFTERIFFFESKEENGEIRKELKFKEFALVIWNYCSLSLDGLARMVFEVFDIDGQYMVNKAHVEAMYRMLYNTDDIDPELLNIYPFDPKTFDIKKADFVDTSCKKTFVIQPAIDFQLRMRKLFGGKRTWEQIMLFRQKNFHVFDKQSDTCNEAFEGILRSVQEMIQIKQSLTSEKLLSKRQQEVFYEVELAERELKLRARVLESEQRAAEATAPDRFMKQAWNNFYLTKQQFLSEEFTTDDLWKRHEARMELFELIDKAVELSREFHTWNDERLLSITEGTDLDHEARYQDYLKTEDGLKLYQLTYVTRLFEYLEKQIHEKNQQNKYYSDINKTDKQVIIESNVIEFRKFLSDIINYENHEMSGYSSVKKINDAMNINKKNNNSPSAKKKSNKIKPSLVNNNNNNNTTNNSNNNTDNQLISIVNKQEYDRRWYQLRKRDFTEELTLLQKYAKKADTLFIETEVNKEMCMNLKKKTMYQCEKQLIEDNNEREKDYKRIEFDVTSNIGSKITRWEYVLQKDVNRYVYVNIDTLQTMHPKTAICEQCDSILVQHELRCSQCDFPRSAKNLKLYRPLGFKDITLE